MLELSISKVILPSTKLSNTPPLSLSLPIASATDETPFAAGPIFLGGFVSAIFLVSPLGCCIGTHIFFTGSSLNPGGQGSIMGLSGSVVGGGVVDIPGLVVSILPLPMSGNCVWSNLGSIPFSISFNCLGKPCSSVP